MAKNSQMFKNRKDPTLKQALYSSGVIKNVLMCSKEVAQILENLGFHVDYENMPTEYQWTAFDGDGNPVVVTTITDKAILFGNENCGICINIELKSHPDASVAVQLFNSETGVHNYFQKMHKAKKAKSGGKYKFTTEDYFPDTINVVIYTGEEQWPESYDYDYLKRIKTPLEKQYYRGGGTSELINLTRLTEEQIKRGGSVVAAINAVLKARSNTAALKAAIAEHKEVLSNMNSDLAIALLTEIKMKRLKKLLQNAIKTNKEETVDMCKAMEDWEKEIREEEARKAAKQTEMAVKQATKEKDQALKQVTKEKEKALKQAAKENKITKIYMFISDLLNSGRDISFVIDDMSSKFRFSKLTARRYFRGYREFVGSGKNIYLDSVTC